MEKIQHFPIYKDCFFNYKSCFHPLGNVCSKKSITEKKFKEKIPEILKEPGG